MAHSVTASDVARAAAVSRVTVSRVLNNHAHVTDDLRQRVLRVAAELGYQHGAVASLHERGPRSSALTEIGFFFVSTIDDDNTITLNPFWSHILAGVEQAARRTSLKVTYRAFTPTSPPLNAAMIQLMRLDGILLVGPTDAETVQNIIQSQLPVVLIDNMITQLSVDAVLCDNFAGAGMAVNHLVQQGHRHIAFIGGPLSNQSPRVHQTYTIEQRAAGYRDALFHAGLELNEQLMHHGQLNIQGGYLACQHLLAANTPFSALFCANDEMAIGAIKALAEAGRSVPEDVSVVGFDNIDVAQHLTPPLTTIHLDKEAMGALGVQILHERMAQPFPVIQQHVLPTKLIIRGTVLPPAAAC